MSDRPRLLDLFCKAGGAGMGYYRAGFDVVGVDIEPQPHYPFEFHQADALEYLAAHGHEFDAWHGSPPCQAHMTFNKINAAQYGVKPHPDFLPQTQAAFRTSSKPWVIENVQGAPMATQFILCGHSLGLVHLARHRHFESNVFIPRVKCTHRRQEIVGVYGSKPDGRRVSHPKNRLNRIVSSIDEAREVMGIDWMDWHEITQAVPPAYTEYIGKHLLAYLKVTP